MGRRGTVAAMIAWSRHNYVIITVLCKYWCGFLQFFCHRYVRI